MRRHPVLPFLLVGCVLAGAVAGQRAAGPPFAPSACWPVTGRDVAVAVRLATDVVSFRAMWREVVAAQDRGAVPDVDFARAAVLLVARPVPAGYRLAWDGARPRDDGACAVTVRAVPVAGAGEPRGDDGEPRGEPPTHAGAMFAVPRPDRDLVVRWSTPGAATELARVPRPPAPAGGERIAVLRVREFADRGDGKAVRCLRATEAGELRELRAAFGLAETDLPDDFADLATCCVVVLATERARVFAGFSIAVATEEGVDVLTLTQAAPSGVDPGQRAPVIALALPRREHALSVVLRSVCGPAPGTETTVTTFPPSGR